jgi:hypothetical protein
MTAVPHRLSHRRAAAYVLSLPWPGGAISRVTLLAAAPDRNALGGPVAAERARQRLKQCLRRWESAGLIQRGKVFVRVLDAAALREKAFDRLPFEPQPHDFVDVPRTAAEIRWRAGLERNPALRRICEAEVALLETLSDAGRFAHIYR